MENPSASAQPNATTGTENIPAAGGAIPSPAGSADGGGPTPDSVKQAAAEAKRKLKIDNEEVDEDEVVKTYKERKGHQRAANKALQEGLALRKQTEEFISIMKDKTKLITALEKIGYKKEDIRKLSEEFLAGALQEEMMDPREKALREAQTKLKTYEQLEQEQKKQAEERRNAELKKKFADDYTTQFVDALKTTGLPPTKPMVAEMAKYIYRASKIGFQMTAVEAAKLVREDVETNFRTLYGESDPETLVKLLGEQGLQKIRGYDTSRLKDPNAVLKTPTEQGEVNRKRDPGRRMTTQEWRDYNRR